TVTLPPALFDDGGLPELAAAQAALRPDAVALSFGDEVLTYAALDSRANRLAGYLRGLGVGPEVRVGVCMRRSPAAVIGLLAVMKAGGVHVPLDPAYPAERLAYMLADCRAEVLLTEDGPPPDLPTTTARVVRLGGERDEILRQDDRPLPRRTFPDSSAYVIYTSGSTGTPKGTVVTHRGIPALARAQDIEFAPGPGCRMLQFASPSFDASIFELVMALGSGGTLCLAEPDRLLPGPELANLLDEQAVTIATLPPSSLTVLPPASLPTLKTLTVAGEACPPALVARWAPGRRFRNLYGPTEATIWSTVATCEPGRPVTIGHAIEGTRVHVLDADMRPVPDGEPGELYLGGDGLARGYWERPARTAERFVPDPFGRVAGARLYRTGDLVRVEPDGALGFLGRVDDQIKFRGYRIEPGEIEAVLRAHPAVTDAAVLLCDDVSGTPRLTAYVTPAVATPPLRAHCAERLPGYLVPTTFVGLDRFPLTANGKTDRRALPSPPSGRDAENPYRAPRTPLEHALAEIWSDLLGVTPVGREDNFLALGGHSLIATQLRSRIQEAFGVDVPVRDVLATPDLAALAGEIGEPSESPARGVPALVPRRDTARVPLSHTQRQLWFLEQLVPGTAAYAAPMVLRLAGPLDVAALEAALNTVVARHEALRTSVGVEDGRPFQAIADHCRIEIPVTDLRDRPETAREAATGIVRRAFDLRHGPLLRASVLRLADQEQLLVLVGHHIVFDGWALRVLFTELAAVYGGSPEPLPVLPVHYADYTLWQRNWLESGAAEEHLAFWREHLADAPALLELPTDRPRPATQRFHGATHTFTVPTGLHEALRKLAREHDATPYMVLLTAYAALLHRHTHEHDITIGTPVANRAHPHTRHLVGYFANTLPLRVRFPRDPSFRKLLERVRETCLDAYGHQEVPFELMIDVLRPERDLSYNPVFQVLFALQNTGTADLGLPGCTATEVDIDPGTSRFDLAFSLSERDGQLRCSVEYNTDLFDQDTVRLFAGRFVRLLEAMTEDPGRRVGEVPLLGGHERAWLTDWNATDAPYRHDRCFHQLVEEQVARTPDAVAIVCGDRQLTYAAFDAHANRLARVLRARGVAAETRVAVFLERSAGSLVALLAVLKAGGAYLPLDTALPADRLAYTLADSGVSVVITTGDLSEGLPAHTATVLRLDEEAAEIAAADSSGLPDGPRPDDLAYLIYTSGSTGRPKGTLMAHRGLANLVTVEAGTVEPTARSRTLQLASFSFDASFWDLAMALPFGGALCVATGEQRLPGPRLETLLDEQAITQATLAPAVLAALPPECAPYLEVLTSTGEALTAEVVRAWAPGRRLLNGYGPTETTVGATIGECTVDDPQPHLGRPFANHRVHVLGPDLRPCPPGVPGEIHIGGPGLARGYAGQPGLTADRFVPDPFAREPGARLYRTGDRGRFLRDGTLTFLGRIDDQVKLRGFRVEPGEIEAVLRRHPAVREAVVLARRDAGTLRLCAYVVSGPDTRTSELREWCARSLPDYMVPGAILRLERMPLTRNGKLDRHALPAPAPDQLEPEHPYVAPETDAEKTLAEIWAQVLHLDRVGRHDNFFTLGGDSI
ncbi:amino acid adenylation domain-containing protein, partial [Amycolatopsis rhizosphaerae]